MRTIRIGSGAGYSGDRIEPAVELAEKGDIEYLVFECLGERTVALAQQARMKNPDSGYDPLLEDRMRAGAAARGCSRCCRSALPGVSRSSPIWARPIRSPRRAGPPRSPGRSDSHR